MSSPQQVNLKTFQVKRTLALPPNPSLPSRNATLQPLDVIKTRMQAAAFSGAGTLRLQQKCATDQTSADYQLIGNDVL
eukprot:380010-Prorocentrum_minimum.AAC.2